MNDLRHLQAQWEEEALAQHVVRQLRLRMAARSTRAFPLLLASGAMFAVLLLLDRLIAGLVATSWGAGL